MKCIVCGEQLPDGTMFCKYCGAEQSQQTPQQQPDMQYQQSGQLNQQPDMQYQQSGQLNQQQYQSGQQQQYQQSGPIPQQQYQQQPQQSPNNGGGKKTLLIVGIVIGAALLIVGIVIIALLVFSMNKNSKKEKTTTVEEITTEATTVAEVVTTETKAEAATEAATEEPEPVTPFFEEKGLKFSDKDDAVSIKENCYEFYLDTQEEEPYDGTTVLDSLLNIHVIQVLRSEPDSDGYVTYRVQLRYEQFSSLINTGGSNAYYSFRNLNPVVFDYYSGSTMTSGNLYGDFLEGGMLDYNIPYNNEDILVSVGDLQTYQNKDEFSRVENEQTDEGKKQNIFDISKSIFVIKAPADYDGLVLAIYKVTSSPERAAKSMEYGKEHGNEYPLYTMFEENFIGYTHTPEDFLYYNICNMAEPETPEKIAEMYSYNNDPYVNSDLAEKLIADNSKGGELITDTAAITGDWCGYLWWDRENSLDCYGEELLNVDITADGSTVNWTFDYDSVKWGEDGEWESKEDADSETYSGTMNSDGTVVFDASSAGMSFTMNGFYTRGNRQYAVGTITVQSGESADVILYRP